MRDHQLKMLSPTDARDARWSVSGAVQHTAVAMLVRGTKIRPCLGPGGLLKEGNP